MLTKQQAQKAIDILGKPTFTNGRKACRTWKWYTEALPALKKLKRAGIEVRSYHSRKENPKMPMWVPEHVTVTVPLEFRFNDFVMPQPKSRGLATNTELKRRLCKKIAQLDRLELLVACSDWGVPTNG